LKRVRAVLVGLIVLLALAAVVAWTAPAELAWRLFGHRLRPLQLDGLSGTVWQGSAERAGALGQALGRLEWQVERGALLSRRLDATIRLDGGDMHGSARVAAAQGAVEISDLDGEFPASLLGPALDIPALTLLGRVSCQFSRLEIQDGLPKRVEGTAVWRDLAVAGAATATLPGLEVRFRTESDGLVAAEVKDLGGPLAIDGQVRMAGERYRTEVRLSLREPNPALEEVLKFVGERTPDGGSILRVEGTLRPIR
jgi:general secretion pathway protein N